MTLSNVITSSQYSVENAIIEDALKILDSRIKLPSHYINNPEEIKAFLRLKLSEKQHEVFAVLFLDSRHGLIKYEEMFRGTIDESTVYPRDIVKEALSCNATSVILVHNHPSRVSEPSEEDIALTERLENALELIDVRVLDHLIIANETFSFAENNLMPETWSN